MQQSHRYKYAYVRSHVSLFLDRNRSIVESLCRNNLAQDSRASKRAPLGKSVAVGCLGMGGRRGMEGMPVHGREREREGEMETDEIVDDVEACREPSVLDATVVEATKSRDLNR